MRAKVFGDCIEALSRDPNIRDLPAARHHGSHPDQRFITYGELFAQSVRLGIIIRGLVGTANANRPICIHMHRTIDWYLCYLACAIEGIPTVCASRDLPDKTAEANRWSDIMSLLDPVLTIIDEGDTKNDVNTVRFDELVREEAIQGSSKKRNVQPDCVLGYHFTGGTTAVSKCVMITHGMAVHEIEYYPFIVPSNYPISVLQNSSVYWPASAFGQIDIAIAFNACLILSVEGGASSDEVSQIVSNDLVECIGIVPSVLRSLDPDLCTSLTTVFTWGEILPKSVASEWCRRVDLIDLLIATEYWLSFYALIPPGGSQGWTYSTVPNTTVTLSDETEDRCPREVWISGPMVSPGYVNNEELNTVRFTYIDGSHTFATKDTMTRVSLSTYSYHGRSDDLQKVGGKFVDLSSIAQDVLSSVGSEIVDECVMIRDSASNVHAVFKLSLPISVNRLVLAVQRRLPSVVPHHVHVVPVIPRSLATGKTDVRTLTQQVADIFVMDVQYKISDDEIPKNRLLAIPNPKRFVWPLLIFVLLCLDLPGILSQCWAFLYTIVKECLWVYSPVMPLIRFPFFYHGLRFLSAPKQTASTLFKAQSILKKLFFEFPGDVLYGSVFLLILAGHDSQMFSPLVRVIALLGDLSVMFPHKDLEVLLRYTAVLASLVTIVSGYSRLLLSVGVNPLFGILLTCISETWSYMSVASLDVAHSLTLACLVVVGKNIEGIKRLAAFFLVFYVNLPYDLSWTWRMWWKNVPTYASLILYYAKHTDKRLKPLSIYIPFRVLVVGTYQFLTTCWDTHTESGYDWLSLKKFPQNTEAIYRCDHCGCRTVLNEGAYDRSRKFSQNINKWYCESCWWGDYVDEGKSHCYPRIGLWTSNWVTGNLQKMITPSVSTPTCCMSEVGSTGYSDTMSEASVQSETAKQCWDSFQAVGVDPALIDDETGLSSLSSLLKVSIHEQLRTRLHGLQKISAMVLFKDIDTFSHFVTRVQSVTETKEFEKTQTTGDGAGIYTIPVSGGSLWGSGPCDWLLRYNIPGQAVLWSADMEERITACFKALVLKHPALRAKPIDDLNQASWLQNAIALSPERLKPTVLSACKTLWPRIQVAPFDFGALVPLKFVTMENSLRQRSVLAHATKYRSHSPFVPPFEAVVYLPPKDQPVTALYTYIRVSHLFADGYCVNAIAADLDTLLTDSLESIECSVPSVTTLNSFRVLEDRLLRSLTLTGTRETDNMCSQTEEVYRDKSLVRVLWLQHRTVQSLMQCGSFLGVPIEIVLMGLVIGSLAEKLDWKRVPVNLMHAMRDNLDESRMLGYFSDYKDMGFLSTECSFVDLFHQLSTRIRNRNWRIHDNSLYDHSTGRHAWDETVFPVSFNVLSHMRTARDSRIENIETYWRAGPRNDLMDCRMIHVYMEETKLEQEWAIRLHVNKRMFDCEWTVDYVCRVFDRALKRVLSEPNEPVNSVR